MHGNTIQNKCQVTYDVYLKGLSEYELTLLRRMLSLNVQIPELMIANTMLISSGATTMMQLMRAVRLCMTEENQ